MTQQQGTIPGVLGGEGEGGSPKFLVGRKRGGGMVEGDGGSGGGSWA